MDKERAGYDQPPSYFTVNAENGDRDTPYTLYGEHNIPTDYQLTASHLQGYEQPYVQSNTTVVVNQPAGGCNRIVLGRPLDYMKISIFACIFCFWPTAIFAIFFASEARRLADAGDWDNARILSNRARYLVASSIILGIVGYAVSIYLYVKYYNYTY